MAVGFSRCLGGLKHLQIINGMYILTVCGRSSSECHLSWTTKQKKIYQHISLGKSTSTSHLIEKYELLLRIHFTLTVSCLIYLHTRRLHTSLLSIAPCYIIILIIWLVVTYAKDNFKAKFPKTRKLFVWTLRYDNIFQRCNTF